MGKHVYICGNKFFSNKSLRLTMALIRAIAVNLNLGIPELGAVIYINFFYYLE